MLRQYEQEKIIFSNNKMNDRILYYCCQKIYTDKHTHIIHCMTKNIVLSCQRKGSF